MADNVRLVTFNGENVTPQDDAIYHDAAIRQSGIIYGATPTISGANGIHLDMGFGIIKGRFFEVFDHTLTVPLSPSGTQQGRVIARLDLSNADEPFTIEAQTGTLPALVQEDDVNINNGVYEILLATFTINATSISNLVAAYDIIDNPYDHFDTLADLCAACRSAGPNKVVIGTASYALNVALCDWTDEYLESDGVVIAHTGDDLGYASFLFFNTYGAHCGCGTFDPSQDTVRGKAKAFATEHDVDLCAPKTHVSSTTKYGAGNANQFGHVKLSDSYTSSGGAASASVGASSKAVYDAYTALNNKTNTILKKTRYQLAANTLNVAAGANESALLSYTVPSGYTAYAVTDVRSNSAKCALLGYNLDTNNNQVKVTVLNVTDSAANGIRPEATVLFVKSSLL